MGLEGLVSKCRDRPYQAGRSKHWIKKPEAPGDGPRDGVVRLAPKFPDLGLAGVFKTNESAQVLAMATTLQ